MNSQHTTKMQYTLFVFVNHSAQCKWVNQNKLGYTVEFVNTQKCKPTIWV